MLMLMDNDFWKTPPDMNCFTPTDYDFELWLCDITCFSKCNLFIVLLPLNVYFLMLNCIHYVFTYIDFYTFCLITIIVGVSVNSSQTFFLHVKFSGHLNVSFVHLFTGILYPKTIIALRAFKYRPFLPVHCIYLTIIFMNNFLQIYGHLNVVCLFICISCFILTYLYVFVYKT